MPFFSIIIPAYNSANYLAESLRSVQNQTFKDFELIVVDDGSTDNTENICKSYKDTILFFKQQNKGVSIARNNGVQKASGDYIIFLDSDDFVAENWLQIFHNLLLKTDSPIACCNSFLKDTATGKLKELGLSTMYLNERKKIYFSQFAGTFTIKRTLFLKYGGYNSNLRFSENTELMNRILYYENIEPLCTDHHLITFNSNFEVFQRNSKFSQVLMNKSFEVLLAINKEFWQANYTSYFFLIRRYIVSLVVLKKYKQVIVTVFKLFFKKPTMFYKYLGIIFFLPVYRIYLLKKGFRA